MAEPKVIKGWMGWAVVGDGCFVYAKTRAEALRRYQDKVPLSDAQAQPITEPIDDGFDVVSPSAEVEPAT